MARLVPAVATSVCTLRELIERREEARGHEPESSAEHHPAQTACSTVMGSSLHVMKNWRPFLFY